MVFETEKLPFSVRVLLESAVRNCDNFHVLEKDVQNILSWSPAMKTSVEIPFKPARVILQDFTLVLKCLSLFLSFPSSSVFPIFSPLPVTLPSLVLIMGGTF